MTRTKQLEQVNRELLAAGVAALTRFTSISTGYDDVRVQLSKAISRARCARMSGGWQDNIEIGDAPPDFKQAAQRVAQRKIAELKRCHEELELAGVEALRDFIHCQDVQGALAFNHLNATWERETC